MQKTVRIFLLFFTVVLFLGSCGKQEPAHVVITVLNDSAVAVPGATVRIYSKPSDSTVDITKVTDSNGRANFEFDTDYVLSVHCEKELDNNQILEGDGVVEIHVNATAEKTIVIK